MPRSTSVKPPSGATVVSSWSGTHTKKADGTTVTIGDILVRCYLFNEGSGTTATDATGGSNGTLVGTSLPTWVTNGLDFEGTVAHVEDGTSDMLGGTGRISIVAKGHTDIVSEGGVWRTLVGKRKSAESNQGMSMARPASSTEYNFYLNTSGTWRGWVTSGFAMAAGTDHQVILTYDAAATPKVWKNGVSVTVNSDYGSGTPAVPSNAAKLEVGNFDGAGGSDQPWDGEIQYVYIFKEPLHADAVAAWYSDPFPLMFNTDVAVGAAAAAFAQQ